MGRIFLLSGEIQSGKSSICLEVVKASRELGLKLGGLISPAVFQGDKKIAIDLLDLRSGERRRLADESGNRSSEVQTKRWAFRPETVAWGNQILETAVPCDLLVIDELGPLEFQRGQGWLAGLEALDSGDFQAALLVIRPSLVDEALSRWHVRAVIDLDDPSETLHSGSELIHYLLES